MAYSIQEILSTKITTRVVTREAAANRYLLSLFGMQPGGFAERAVGHRQFGYDVFNDTRTVAAARGPGAPAATVTRQKVGRVDGVFPRFYEKLPLLSEELHNFRQIGGPASIYDERGAAYVLRQQRYMGQRLGNNRLLLLAGMLRGALYGHTSGDATYYDFTSSGADFTINWQRPSGNTLKFNMDGGGDIISASWATASTDIPGHLRSINSKLQIATGTTLDLIICPANVWNAVMNNDAVQAQAGTSNPPFTQQERVIGTDANGRPQTVILGRIAAQPQVQWLITNEGIKIGTPGSESFVQYVPDNYIWWGPMPSPTFYEMLLGSEPVNEGYGAQEVVRFGAHAWTKLVDDPAGRMLYTVDNAIPADYIPAASGYGTVIY